MQRAVSGDWQALVTALVIPAGLFLAVSLYRQWTSDENVSVRYESENAAGTTSVMISGTHVVAMLAGVIAVLTWPLALESGLGIVLGLAVIGSYIAGKREAGFN